jgi:hypothetical protein
MQRIVVQGIGVQTKNQDAESDIWGVRLIECTSLSLLTRGHSVDKIIKCEREKPRIYSWVESKMIL